MCDEPPLDQTFKSTPIPTRKNPKALNPTPAAETKEYGPASASCARGRASGLGLELAPDVASGVQCLGLLCVHHS